MRRSRNENGGMVPTDDRAPSRRRVPKVELRGFGPVIFSSRKHLLASWTCRPTASVQPLHEVARDGQC